MIRDYTYIEYTASLCPVCKAKTEAKIIQKGNSVYILKKCREHGESMALLEENAEYYLNRHRYDKPGNVTSYQSAIDKGCPFDCGLCPSHEQHTCIGLIEITTKCNLKCPVCYAAAGEGDFLDYSGFERMLDFFVESEGGHAEILQISGGEPTLHPLIIDFIRLARTKNISYIMLNTNGLRIASDPDFAAQLSQFRGGFEVYLQFDGFDDAVYDYFRGQPLAAVKIKAVDILHSYNIPVTLVTTLEKGINDHILGKLIEFGISTRCVRGINLQPAGYFGRTRENMPGNRLTLSSVIKKIEEQTSSMIRTSDFVPLPCNVDRVALTYLYKTRNKEFIPLTRNLDIQKYVPLISNTFQFNPDDFLKIANSGVSGGSCCKPSAMLKDFSRLIPVNYLLKNEEEKIEYVTNNTFRISITSFLDVFNFDIKSAQKECVHFITRDLKKIPFSTYNLFHRK